jgi:hypothetical protein
VVCCQTSSNPTLLDYAGRCWRSVIFCTLMMPTLALGQSDFFDDLVTAIEGDSQSESESSAATPAATPVTPVAASGFGVAVLDTGVEMVSPITPAVMLPGSASFVGGNPLVDYADQGTHGTAVAQLIRTLSPGSHILSLQTSTGSRSGSASAVAQALHYAAANPSIRVINHSNAALAIVPGDALLATALADQVVVMGSGNDRLPNPNGDALHAPGLGGKALIVGGLGPDGEMLGFSNRAGGYAQHYVVAWGASQFADYWGTSFATPRVSALAAELRQRWPDLRAEQVTDIIKRSSTDMGAPGVDAKYGWGRINSVRAFQPLGALTTPAGSTTTEAEEEQVNPSGSELHKRRLRLGTPIFGALMREPTLLKVLALDRYGRNFSLNLSAMVSGADTKSSIRRIARDWAAPEKQALLSDGVGYRVFSYGGTDSTGAPKLRFDFSGDTAHRHQLSYSMRPEQRNGAINWLPRLANGLTAGSAWQRSLLTEDLEEGFYSLSTYQLGAKTTLDLAFADTHDNESMGQQNQVWSSAVHFATDTFGATFEGGLLHEDGSLFGGAPGGALSVDAAETRFLRLSGYRSINSRLAVLAAYTGALTEVDASSGKLIDNFSDLSSQAWLVGLGAKKLFASDDAASLTLSQPLRVTTGSADLDVPYALGPNGRIFRYRQRISMAPTGTETLLEMTYRFKLSPVLEFGVYGSLRNQAGHDERAGLVPQMVTVVRGKI